MAQAYDAVVIGAGANGLAAAAMLARAGRRTIVLERGAEVGGSDAAVEFAPGFRAAPLGLDAGWVPPGLVRGLGLDLPGAVPLDAVATIAVDPGRFISFRSDPRRMAEAIRGTSRNDAEAWPEFSTMLEAFMGVFRALYQAPPPDIGAGGYAQLSQLARLALHSRRLGRAGVTQLLRIIPMSVGELLEDTFKSDPLKAVLASIGVRGIRQGPRSGGTAFVMLHNLITSGRFWRDGPHALITALEAAAKKAGATIRTNAEVARIEIRDDAVAGVVLEDGEMIPARAALSSADPTRTLLGMIDPVWLDPEFLDAVRHIKYRGCTSYVLYALDALPELPPLASGSLRTSGHQSGQRSGSNPLESVLAGSVTLTPTMQSLERAYDEAKYGRIPEHPHIEVTIPSLRWPDTAPVGKHVLVARAHYTPYSLHGNQPWDEAQRATLSDRVTDSISCVFPGFADRVLEKAMYSPQDLEAHYGYTEGAASQGELMLDQILFMRPVAGWSRYAMPIAGLYLCGAGTHPGPGVPGGPGWLAAREALSRGH